MVFWPGAPDAFPGASTWPVRFAGVLATLLAVGAPSRVSASELEDQVKAEFMELFTRFIDWPEAAFPTPGAPFVFCTVGADT